LLEKDIRIDFNLSSLNAAAAGPAAEAPLHQSGFWPVARARDEAKPFPDPATRAIADRYNHLSFILSPDLAQRQRVPGSVVRYKRQLIDAYVHAYGDLAKRHREAYGIPASMSVPVIWPGSPITILASSAEGSAGDAPAATMPMTMPMICFGCFPGPGKASRLMLDCFAAPATAIFPKFPSRTTGPGPGG